MTGCFRDIDWCVILYFTSLITGFLSFLIWFYLSLDPFLSYQLIPDINFCCLLLCVAIDFEITNRRRCISCIKWLDWQSHLLFYQSNSRQLNKNEQHKSFFSVSLRKFVFSFTTSSIDKDLVVGWSLSLMSYVLTSNIRAFDTDQGKWSKEASEAIKETDTTLINCLYKEHAHHEFYPFLLPHFLPSPSFYSIAYQMTRCIYSDLLDIKCLDFIRHFLRSIYCHPVSITSKISSD